MKIKSPFLLSVALIGMATAAPMQTDGRSSAALGRRTARVHEEANPEELAGKFEGDIDLPPTFNPRHRNALANKGQLWPNGIVYYTISDSFAQYKKNNIMAAMQEIMDVTKVGNSKCIQYTQRTTQQDYINIQPLRGCYSSVGRIGYDQDLSLGSGCERRGTAMHELMHALGFFHEQSRADRDDFVTVHFENILPGRAKDFNKYTLGTQVDHLNQPYDYGSIMHYNRTSFSKNDSSPTLTPKQAGVTIGQRIGLSPTDIKKIQLLYGCTVRTGPVSINSGCKDIVDNCKAYGNATCTDYEPWAREYCRLTCQYCKPAVTKPKETCADKLDNCDGYGTSGCIGDYEPWARDKCALTCGYCTADTTTTTAPPPVCKDELSNCKAYGKGWCVYEPWTRQRCAKYCGYCYDPHETTTVTTPTTVTTASSCRDHLEDCHTFGKSACYLDFEPWARVTCPVFCGYCGDSGVAAVTTTPPGATTPSTLFSSTTCDFNKDLCGWKNSKDVPLDWRRRSSSTPTYATGPNADYEGGGHYLYVEASGNYDKVAKLVSSRSYPSDTPLCVRFASHMYGSNMGILRIAATGDNFYYPLFRLQGDKGNQWTMNNVNLSVSGRSFKIVFEAIVGYGPRSDLAIDNISVGPGKCT